MQFIYIAHARTHTHMNACLVICFLGRHPEQGWGRLGKKELWLQLPAQVCPAFTSLLHPLTQPLVPLPPGSQVQLGDTTAVDKVLRESVGHEDVVLGHSGDACVVADDARQADLGQGLLLPRAEYTLVLPPKPAWEHHGRGT